MSEARAARFDARERIRILHAEGATARVQSGKKTFSIDLLSGAATAGDDARELNDAPEIDIEALARSNWRRAQELGIGADSVPIEVPIEVAGAIVTVSASESHQEYLTTVTFGRLATIVPGEPLEIVSRDGSLVCVRTVRGVFVLDTQQQRVLAEIGYVAAHASALHIAAHDDFVVITTGQSLHYIRRTGEWTRVPLPFLVGELALTERCIVVASNTDLFAIDRSSIETPPGMARHDIGLNVAPRADARSDDGAHVVRSILRQFVALTEVRTQRAFNVTMDSGAAAQRFAKGDRVYFVDNRLVKESELPAGFGAPERLVLDASALPALDPVAPSPLRETQNNPMPPGVEELRAEIGFRLSPVLQRMIARSGSDWCWPFGAFTPSTDKADVGTPIDPRAVPIFDQQSGDYICLYDYPPARADGHGFVCFMHDEGGLTWLGRDFEETLASALREEIKHESGTGVMQLLRGLNLPITFLDEHPRTAAPEWFVRAHPPQTWPYRTRPDPNVLLSDADRLRGEGDLMSAERLYVRVLHETFDKGMQARALKALADVYRDLGWNFQVKRV